MRCPELTATTRLIVAALFAACTPERAPRAAAAADSVTPAGRAAPPAPVPAPVPIPVPIPVPAADTWLAEVQQAMERHLERVRFTGDTGYAPGFTMCEGDFGDDSPSPSLVIAHTRLLRDLPADVRYYTVARPDTTEEARDTTWERYRDSLARHPDRPYPHSAWLPVEVHSVATLDSSDFVNYVVMVRPRVDTLHFGIEDLRVAQGYRAGPDVRWAVCSPVRSRGDRTEFFHFWQAGYITRGTAPKAWYPAGGSWTLLRRLADSTAAALRAPEVKR